MKEFSALPSEMLTSAWRHRHLLAQMTKREIIGRYRGSLLGIVWSLFNPLLMLLVYTFVFSVVFKARWQTGGESNTEFAIVLFAGMIVFGIFAECVNRAPGLIIANPSYVKKVVFPLEIMPLVSVGAAIFHAAISLLVLVLFSWLSGHTVPPTALLFPVVIAPLLLFVLGLAWFLAALGVFLRDVGQTIGLITTALMFISPVFYPLSALPDAFGRYMIMSPIAFVIEAGRDVLIWGVLPDWKLLLIHCGVALLVAWCGFVWFQKTRRGFGDVL